MAVAKGPNDSNLDKLNMVAQGQTWKDHIDMERQAARRWPWRWGFMATTNEELLKDELRCKKDSPPLKVPEHLQRSGASKAARASFNLQTRMLNVRLLGNGNVTEAEHHDASVSKETETLARVSPYKGEGKKSMIGTKWFVDDEVSNDMSSQCEFGVPVRHANETQMGGGNGVPMQSDKCKGKDVLYRLCCIFMKFHVVGLALAGREPENKGM
ncbi:hypothetical protein NDU88_000840 [Pleurodeles waltl]|uniref:Uncharacterized protein n=1 Tax=Pleurodeles waltl TaxID=8319 RepID=A0AAV7SB77_PLEWA|nr:hypothetical protein NDU88_000840 [Pleurodeles waltl]